MEKPMITIGGLCAPQGSKAQGFVTVPGTSVQMPVTIVNGAFPGKTLLVTAGLHSGEYPGVAAVTEQAKDVDPARIHGQILFIHCVNTPGFFVRSDGLVPDDGKNLNRIFPGNPNGTVSERIAAFIKEEFLSRADFVADLHSGGAYEPLTDCLFYPLKEEVRERALAAAKTLDIPYAIASTASTGLYSYAVSMGIPGLLLERDGAGFCTPQDIANYRRDIQSLMVHLGLLPGPAAAPSCVQRRVLKTTYLSCPVQGLWYSKLQIGQEVTCGEKLGEIRDFFGTLLRELFAGHDGIVFYTLSCLAVNVGDNLAAYGEASPA